MWDQDVIHEVGQILSLFVQRCHDQRSQMDKYPIYKQVRKGIGLLYDGATEHTDNKKGRRQRKTDGMVPQVISVRRLGHTLPTGQSYDNTIAVALNSLEMVQANGSQLQIIIAKRV